MTQLQLDGPPLYSSLANDPMLRELVEQFVEEMPERAARFRADFEGQDWDGLRRAAHQIKGSAGSYGFDQLTPTAATLEVALIKRAPLDEISGALEALLSQFARTTSEEPR